MNQSESKKLHSFITSYLSLPLNRSGGWIKLDSIISDFSEREIIRYNIENNWRSYFNRSEKNNGNYLICLTNEGRTWYEKQQYNNDLPRSLKIARSIKKYANKLKPISIKVNEIKELNRLGLNSDSTNRYVYLATISEIEMIESPLVSEMQVRLEIKFEENARTYSINGLILGQESEDSNSYYIGLEDKISNCFFHCYLIVERKFIHMQLAERIDDIEKDPVHFKKINTEPAKNYYSTNEGGSDDVPHLILDDKSASWTKLIWGPPGTGKSYAIAELVNLYLLKHPTASILLVAPTNQAVDSLTNQLVLKKDMKGLNRLFVSRNILRYGFPKLIDVLDNKEILGPKDFDTNAINIKNLAKNIQDDVINGTDNHIIAEKRAKLFDLQSQHKNDIQEHAKKVQTVATTTTQTFLKLSPLTDRMWDLVILDEASMISAAICYYLASRSKNHFLIVGDPYQLSPVFNEITETYDTESNIEPEKVTNWLAQNVYERCSMFETDSSESLLKVKKTENMYSLNSQFRCVPKIWDSVKSLYPSMNNKSKSQSDIVACEPFSNDNIMVIDTSEIKNYYNQTQFLNKSRFNEYSAGLTMSFAIKFYLYNNLFAIENNIKTSIVTPYRAQVNQLKSYIKDSDSFKQIARLLKIGTIHSFQGDESAIVYVDLVESNLKNKKLGKIVIDEQGLRLINVATTRAKAKLVLVVNCRYFYELGIKESNPLLYRILDSNQKIVMSDTPLLFDRSDTKWEQKFMDAFQSEWRERRFRTKKYPLPIQHHKILLQGAIPYTKPDFAFPEYKIAVYVDGASTHFYSKDIWERDYPIRNRLRLDDWIVLQYTNSRITNNCRDCIDEVFEILKKRISQSGFLHDADFRDSLESKLNQGKLF